MPEIKVQLGSKLTKRFLEDKRSKLHQQLSDELGVTILTYAVGANFIKISTDDDRKAEMAELMMQALDQRVGVMAENYSIRSKDDISSRFIGMASAEAQDLLSQIKTKPLAEFRKQIIVPPASNTNIPSVALSADFEDARDSAPATEIPFVKERTRGKASANKTADTKQSSKFEPRNKNSAIAMQAIMDPNIALVFMVGPAGTSKTFTPIQAAVDLHDQGKINKFVAIKPRTTTGKKDIGALKGGLSEKLGPYTNSGIASNFYKVTGKSIDSCKSWVETKTPDFERGETHENCLILIDEAQNMSIQEAELLLTRIGDPDGMKHTKFVITGDISGKQDDLRGEMPGLAYLISHIGEHILQKDTPLSAATAAVFFTKEDAVARSRLLPFILDAFENPSEKLSGLMAAYEQTSPNAARQKAIDNVKIYAGELMAETARRTYSNYEKSAKAAFPALFGESPIRLVSPPVREANLA
jgi:phosphate starvation-inducible PhoH-like protein